MPESPGRYDYLDLNLPLSDARVEPPLRGYRDVRGFAGRTLGGAV